MTKKFRLYLASAVFALATALSLGIFAQTAFAAGVDTTRDCDETAIIHCGVMTLSELKTKYAANEAGDLPAVYKAFGVTNFDGFVDGVVWRDGTVTIGDKTVATGAMTAARNMPGGDIAGSSANVISPSVWPAQYISGKPAYIKMVNGSFAYAVLKTCGNPVKAKPVTPPKPPVTPVAVCERVTPIKVSRDTYNFKGEASASGGATITGYTFKITHSSGSAKLVNVSSNTTSAMSGEMRLEEGTHTIELTVRTSLGERTGAACKTTVTVPSEAMDSVCNPETGEVISVKISDVDKYVPVGDAACKPAKVCNPETGKIVIVKPTEVNDYKPVGDEACQPKVEGVTTIIPATGPADLVAGGFGLTSLTAAGYYWRASRRKLTDTLLHR